MQVTCVEWTREELKATLEEARKQSVRNIMCLRGDASASSHLPSAFDTAAELVKFVRQEFGNSFCIAVAGYPEGCLGLGRESPEYQADLQALKAKVCFFSLADSHSICCATIDYY